MSSHCGGRLWAHTLGYAFSNHSKDFEGWYLQLLFYSCPGSYRSPGPGLAVITYQSCGNIFRTSYKLLGLGELITHFLLANSRTSLKSVSLANWPVTLLGTQPWRGGRSRQEHLEKTISSNPMHWHLGLMPEDGCGSGVLSVPSTSPLQLLWNASFPPMSGLNICWCLGLEQHFKFWAVIGHSPPCPGEASGVTDRSEKSSGSGWHRGC